MYESVEHPCQIGADVEAAPTIAKSPTRISFVIAMYGVAQYLSAFLESLEEQAAGPYTLECIFVDDGSPDDSAAIAEAWLESSKHSGRVVRKENGGVSSARNAGIPFATGEWISFPDSDDFLDRMYLRGISRFLRSKRGAAAHLVAANVHRYFDETGEVRNTHALRFKFNGAAKNVNLVRSPHYIQLMATSAFARLEVLRERGLLFSEQLSNSEDAVFIAELLSDYDEPILGIVPEALYFYRKRASLDSAVDTSFGAAAGYLDRYRFGYLPLFTKLGADGRFPEWAANLLIYELSWMFAREKAVSTSAAVLTAAERAELLGTIGRCLQDVADEWILGYRITTLSLEIRYLLLTLKGSPLPRVPLHVRRLDKHKDLLQIRYFFVGARPVESFRVRAKEIAPVAAKVRRLDFFGQTELFERIVWLPANSWLAADLDGVRQELRLGLPSAPTYALTEQAMQSFFHRSPAPVSAGRTGLEVARAAPPSNLYRKARRTARGLLDSVETWNSGRAQRRSALAKRRKNADVRRMRKLAQRPSVRTRYADAWVLMDRLNMAQDNAEHMYRFLAASHPEVNPWFVLSRDSKDWNRLKSDGFRLVAFRSKKHVLLMLNAAHMISSHADAEMLHPIPPAYYRSHRDWRLTFLQHGIIKDDLSAWLNPKDIALFITSTQPEYDSIVSDGTGYVFTSKEVALTGLPRHDDLLVKRARRLAQGGDRFLLVAPTWRESLLVKKQAFSLSDRGVIDGFAETEYAKAWFGLLQSPELAKIAQDNGLTVAFLPHPNLQPHVKSADLPDGVRFIRYEDGDVQDVIAAASLLVTDYSSLALEVAILDVPVVYFQFDEDSFFGNSHTYSKGYFDYRADGFGPVAQTEHEVLRAIREGAACGGEAPEPYKSRAERTFIYRDGKCRERVYEQIALLDVPNPPA
ncbi:CDP-glycerol glycerophosphotransferase family protein [Cryobacterium sp. TMT1-2-1]|uniref:bifunctional glycosyltransferase/CDP-glycerol:glycerophosphate glycerophosphotransferase n=1 Tax=Cryobacterium sp. TMT1-2-1 TaxID=1259232 RepID=UPI00141A6FA2|nr:CDP-glycerol glycerophosphotransferase family protein [Cryobacterium sp. TMT1-2-1]